LYGIVMGMSRDEIVERLPMIQAFAGIDEFIDRPVKSYSSGMFVRLAFSAAIHVNPDVLLVDEALAVGDVLFQHQCIRRIREMQASGTTIVFVSHDMGMMRSICSEAVLLDRGRIEAHDDPATIANIYHAKTANAEAASQTSGRLRTSAEGVVPVTFRMDKSFDERVRLFRHGTGAARIRHVELLDRQGQPVNSVEFDDEVILRVHVQYYEDAAFSILGFSIRDKTGTDVVGSNTHEENVPLPPRLAGDTVVVDFRQRLPLAKGTYSVSTALAYDRSKPSYFDWVDNALVLTILPPESGKVIHGKVALPVDIAVHLQ
jgi:lipopolysaccharide transport system ATP-binding protein